MPGLCATSVHLYLCSTKTNAIELYWDEGNELKFKVHLKENQELKYLNKGSMHRNSVFSAKFWKDPVHKVVKRAFWFPLCLKIEGTTIKLLQVSVPDQNVELVYVD